MSLKISRILHAGYLFESQDTKILFDPLFENPFSRNCYAYPAVEFDKTKIAALKVNAVFISHYHDDHCSFESLNLLDKTTPIYMFCLHDEMFSLLKELGFSSVHSLTLDKAVSIGDFCITTRRAVDAEVDALFQVECQGFNILNVVDSWIASEDLALLAKLRWDLVLWPFQTMRERDVLCPSRAEPAEQVVPEEWLNQLKQLSPRWIVPSACQFIHEEWSWYRQAFFPITYKSFSASVQRVLPEATVVRMNPLTSWALTNAGLLSIGNLDLGEPVGDQDVDYEYNAFFAAPATSEVAAHFTKLSPVAEELILNFCRSEIIQRYAEVGPAEDPYFQVPRLWRLCIYDAHGKGENFYYRLNEAEIELIEAPGAAEVHWLTEIPAARLYGAIAEGESLSSLYIRINDAEFAAKTEEKIRDVDVLQDPLLRCLYNGKFASYQKAQLKRLQKS